MSSTVLRNTTWYTLAGLLPNLVNFLMLPVYTRYLDPADYGIVALVTTAAAVIGVVLGLQLQNSVARMYFDYRDGESKIFFSSLLIGLVAINALLLTGLHLGGPRLTRWVFPEVELAYYPFMLLGLVTVAFRSVVNYLMAMLRVLERGRAVFNAALGNMIAGVGLGVLQVVILGRGAQGVLEAGAMAAAVHMVCLLWLTRDHLGFTFRRDMLSPALRYSLPLIPHGFGGLIFMAADKYILSFFVPLAAIGLYELAFRFAQILRLIVLSFHNAVSPAFMKQSAEDRMVVVTEFRNLIAAWAGVVSLLYLSIALFSQEFIVWFTPERYHGAAVFVPVLTAGFLFRGLYYFATNALLFEKKTMVIPLITVLTGLFNVVGNVLLIPRFGIMAAAWTSFASFVLSFLIALPLSRRWYRIEFPWRDLAWMFGLTGAITVLVGRIGGDPGWESLVIKTAAIAGFTALLWIFDPGRLRTGFLQRVKRRQTIA